VLVQEVCRCWYRRVYQELIQESAAEAGTGGVAGVGTGGVAGVGTGGCSRSWYRRYIRCLYKRVLEYQELAKEGI
jgi:hypothetical protein